MTMEDFNGMAAEMRIRHRELDSLLSDPKCYQDRARAAALTRERGKLEAFFRLHESWALARRELSESQELLRTEQDAALRAMIEHEVAVLAARIAADEHAAAELLRTPDENDARGVIMEIRPAVGGEEAALFAGDMFRVYAKYAERRRWKMELLALSGTGLGGVKEAVFSLAGREVFSRMKFESGVHRVQRVPVTEAGGRLHTSTITVAVLPEAEERDGIVLSPGDLEISTFRSSGPGGQNVNRTDSAVRIVHKPSGLVAASQQERSQVRNREIALRILRGKLLAARRAEEARKLADDKRRQVGAGDRSERIRTYNFPQNRITDHRHGISVFDLPALMAGNLDLILEPVIAEESRKNLENLLHAKGK